jgi:cell division protein FtsB
MANEEISNKTKAILITLVVVFIFLQYKLWFGQNGLVQTFHLKKGISKQKVKNTELLKNNTELTKEINALKSSNETIENRARNELGMVKKGEVFYQVVK